MSRASSCGTNAARSSGYASAAASTGACASQISKIVVPPHTDGPSGWDASAFSSYALKAGVAVVLVVGVRIGELRDDDVIDVAAHLRVVLTSPLLHSGGEPSEGTRASAQAAAASRRRSSPGAATSCSPSGRRCGPSPVGTVIAGAPVSDQREQKRGSPVVSGPGASPMAGRVSTAS